MKIVYSLSIITLLFIVWSEYSVGQILFRPNSTGQISMNIGSMANFMINPFYKTDLWRFKTLDINYVFIMILSVTIILSHELFGQDETLNKLI